jgi:hypothetical protein
VAGVVPPAGRSGRLGTSTCEQSKKRLCPTTPDLRPTSQSHRASAAGAASTIDFASSTLDAGPTAFNAAANAFAVARGLRRASAGWALEHGFPYPTAFRNRHRQSIVGVSDLRALRTPACALMSIRQEYAPLRRARYGIQAVRRPRVTPWQACACAFARCRLLNLVIEKPGRRIALGQRR